MPRFQGQSVCCGLRSAAAAVLLTSAALAPLAAGCRPDLAPFPPPASPAEELAAALAALTDRPEARDLAYWSAKPPPAELIAYPFPPVATDADRAAAAALRAGEFQPSPLFASLPLGVPPPWDENPLGSNTWDFYRHSLRWLAPLVAVWYADGDAACLRLVEDVLRDWRRHNGERPGASPFSWGDHASANRLTLFCWLWEVYRASPECEPGLARLLLELIHQHAVFIAGGETYRPDSNHGLEQNIALLATAAVVPEFRAAAAWHDVAAARTTAYVTENFAPEGFHLEQSPGYHWFVLSKLAMLRHFLSANSRPAIPGLDAAARRAAAVWPYLVKPDGLVANVGDTGTLRAPEYRSWALRWWGPDAPPPAAATLSSPRAAPGELLLSFGAGYAIFTAYAIGTPAPAPDTYALFRCNAFRYTHYHRDALSFVLYGLGRDWLIDAGVYNYDESAPQRQYARSPRAHNLVLVDEQDFALGPVSLLDYGRTPAADFVRAAHRLPAAGHTREFRFVPPATVELHDRLAATDGRPHIYSQLLHVDPALTVEIVSDRQARLVAPDGCAAIIEQKGPAGGWRLVTGQTEPVWQGWLARDFEQIEPAPTLYYECPAPAPEWSFDTRITLHAAPP